MFSTGGSVPEIKPLIVMEVPAGSTAVLNCDSNDVDHNFMFWLFNSTNVIGPGTVYNEQKYKYEVLSGKLHIHDVTAKETGYYNCISKKLSGLGYNVSHVNMILTDIITPMKITAILLSIIVLLGCALLYYKMRKDWKRYEGKVPGVIKTKGSVTQDDVEAEFQPKQLAKNLLKYYTIIEPTHGTKLLFDYQSSKSPQ